jgi:hypothetical protein
MVFKSLKTHAYADNLSNGFDQLNILPNPRGHFRQCLNDSSHALAEVVGE